MKRKFQGKTYLTKRRKVPTRTRGYRRMRKAVITDQPIRARTAGYFGLEYKFIDYEKDTSLVTTVAGAEVDDTTAGSCSSIAQGDGESNRDGRKAVLKSWYVSGAVKLEQKSAQTTSLDARVVTIYGVLDTQTNGAQLNSEDFLKDPSTATLDFLAVRNLENSKRFKTIFKERCVLKYPSAQSDGSANTGEFNGDYYLFDVNKKLDVPVTFTGTTATVASISDNSLHIIAVTSGDSVKLQYISRVRFVG